MNSEFDSERVLISDFINTFMSFNCILKHMGGSMVLAIKDSQDKVKDIHEN